MADTPTRSKHGPLSGTCIGLLAGPEFSDFQAYYLNLYLSELGAQVVNLVIGWPEVGWKMTRPATSDTVQGTFGLRLDPIPTMAPGDRYTTRVFRSQSQLGPDAAEEFDALIVLGGHSADVLRVDPAVTAFVAAAWQRGVVVGALECGQMVLMSAGIIAGQRVTGYRVVRPFLSRLGSYQDRPVVVDGNLITARDSDATPQFVRALARHFQPSWDDPAEGLLNGKRILIVAGQDFEDVELCVPAMEFDQRGAQVILGTFPAPVVSRPPMLGVEVVMGNFGMSVPFQELDASRYPVVRLADLTLDDFDALMIPGAFCPWNCLDEGSPVELCRRAAAAGKVVAAICHGPLVLAAADLVEGRRIAGFTACRDDVITMGAHYDFALRNACPHQSGPLCLGQLRGLLTATDQKRLELTREGEIVRCPWHGWEFDITNGRSVFNPHRLRVRSYPVTIELDEDDQHDPSIETFPVTVERGRVVVHV